MPTNPLDAKLKKITDLFQTAVLFYWRAADNDRLRRLIIQTVEKAVVGLVSELRTLTTEPLGCPDGMVEGRNGKCMPR